MKDTTPAHGYCNQCHRPAVVIGLNLSGWAHEFRICSVCLTAIARRIDQWHGQAESGREGTQPA